MARLTSIQAWLLAATLALTGGCAGKPEPSPGEPATTLRPTKPQPRLLEPHPLSHAFRVSELPAEHIDKQIEFLKRLLAATAEDDSDYPDFAFRLGLHFAEGSVVADSPARRREFAYAARKVFERLVVDRRFVSYARRDYLLFEYADITRRLGDEVAARHAIARLLRDYPTSPHAADGFLLMAFVMCTHGQINEARALRKRAASRNNLQARTREYLTMRDACGQMSRR